MFRENRADCPSDTAAYKAIAPRLSCSPDSLRVWSQQGERDTGQRAGLTSAEKDRIKDLEREVRDLGRDEILFAIGPRTMVERIYRYGGARPPVPQMIAFIDDHRGVFGAFPLERHWSE